MNIISSSSYSTFSISKEPFVSVGSSWVSKSISTINAVKSVTKSMKSSLFSSLESTLRSIKILAQPETIVLNVVKNH